jgi:NADP-reducing hydrogenase subunit HndB
MGYCYAEPTVEVTLPGHAPLVFGYVNKKSESGRGLLRSTLKMAKLVDGIIPELYHSIDETGKEK